MKKALCFIILTISIGYSAEKPVSITNISQYKVSEDTDLTRFDDNSKGVTCYVYGPIVSHYITTCDVDKYTGRKKNCVRTYDGNTVGSLSCVKM